MVGYRRLAAMILVKACDDHRAGNGYSDDAREFLAGPWAARLVEGLDLAPEHLARFLASDDRRTVRQVKADTQAEGVLALYRKAPRLEQHQVAALLGIGKGSVAGHLVRLERAGRLVRRGDDGVEVLDIVY